VVTRLLMTNLLMLNKPDKSRSSFKCVRVDQEANVLANRIAMLQNEEKRLQKKIDNTRKRA
jgi:hypothetical protein